MANKYLWTMIALGGAAALYAMSRGDGVGYGDGDGDGAEESAMPGYEKIIQEALESGDPVAIRAVIVQLTEAGLPQAAADLEDALDALKADILEAEKLDAAWSKYPPRAGESVPALAGLTDDQLEDLHAVLVGSIPEGSGKLYLDGMAILEEAGKGEYARWLEWIGQNNGALPPAGTPAGPQEYSRLFAGLVELLGPVAAALLQANITEAVASGKASQIHMVAYAAQNLGATEMAEFLHSMANAMDANAAKRGIAGFAKTTTFSTPKNVYQTEIGALSPTTRADVEAAIQSRDANQLRWLADAIEATGNAPNVVSYLRAIANAVMPRGMVRMVSQAMASGDADQLRAAADLVETAGNSELAAHLRNLASAGDQVGKLRNM